MVGRKWCRAAFRAAAASVAPGFRPQGTALLVPLVALASIALCGCSYLESGLKQAGLMQRYREAPSQRLYKHMLSSSTFFVFGRVENGSGLNLQATALLAVSDMHREGEVVDVSHRARPDNYYGLNLPAGQYRLMVVSDLNHDGAYTADEVVGGRPLHLDPQALPGKVLGEYHIDLAVPLPAQARRLAADFRLDVNVSPPLAESLFFPPGSIRSLDDDLFSPQMASLGMYEPAVFMEEAPMMFYALEEDLGYKVPVVFVHGIGGSPRDFSAILPHLDRRRYRPWFFYYPSGYDLGQLGEMFHKIFLSGKTFFLGQIEMVIVAHSMGGLVVREAFNHLEGREGENRVAALVTVASPLGGHPAAAMAAQGPVLIPSWRDVDPSSEFMHQLRRKKLPAGLDYHLLYAFGNESTVKVGENSDGVVPLSSQLCREAQEEATKQVGFDATHSGVLADPQAIATVMAAIEAVRVPYPEEHMAELFKGGYDLPLVGDYSPLGRYCIRHVGRWLDALAAGRIAPFDEQHRHFVAVVRGEAQADTEVEKDWLRFIAEYPQRTGL